MKDFVGSVYADNMMLEIPAEYAEYIRVQPGELVFHDPENDEQAAIVAKMKSETVSFFAIVDVLFLLIFICIIVSVNKFMVIFLMGLLTALFMIETVRVVRRKLQVVTGRAVIKMKKRRHDKRSTYLYYVAVAVDQPEKAIYSGISVSKEDYDKIQEGTPIMIVNISSPGKGVVLDRWN